MSLLLLWHPRVSGTVSQQIAGGGGLRFMERMKLRKQIEQDDEEVIAAIAAALTVIRKH